MKFNKLTYLALGSALAMGFTACNDDDVEVIGYGDPITATGSPLAGVNNVNPSTTDITVTFNTDVLPANISKITVNDQVPDSVSGSGNVLLIYMPDGLTPLTEYNVTLLPYSVMTASGEGELKGFLEDSYSFSFKTDKDFYFKKENVAKAPVNPNADAAARKLYSFLLDNYGTKTLTGAMGGVAWEDGYCRFVQEKSGKYPAIVGFDFIHFRSSEDGANWINYDDITPVKEVWEAGSIPTISWHWLMPEVDASDTDTELATFENVIYDKTFECSNWGSWLDLPTAGWAENLKAGEYLIFKAKGSGAIGIRNDDWSNTGGVDFTDGTNNVVIELNDAIIADLQANATIHISGSVTFTAIVHADSPALEPKVNYIYNGSYSPAKALTEGTPENAEINANIAVIARYLGKLQEAGIPVLWRPLHEAAGDYTRGSWFWWGNDGVEVTKELWKYLYDKLTNEYKLNNLIWVWTMQTSDAGELANISKLIGAYPGDDCVDMVGVDSYEKETGVDITAQFRLLANAVDQHKMVAVSEIGNLVDFQASMNNDAPWSFFMNWYTINEYEEWSLDGNSRKVWRNTVSLPFMLNRGDFSLK